MIEPISCLAMQALRYLSLVTLEYNDVATDDEDNWDAKATKILLWISKKVVDEPRVAKFAMKKH